ncbi:MAG: ureidoglycolate lyase [Planctomycetota bacterium]|nr:MAG: ureidoglycolate lyase [Planctomycetota bacterium]
MQLIRIGELNQEKPGVLIDGKQIDLSTQFDDWNQDFFENNGLSKLKKALKENSFEEFEPNQRIGSCIARPRKIICIGLNYFDHAKEAGMEVPKEPIVFMKATNTISGPYDNVLIPPGSIKSDWEVELGIVIEKECSYLKSEEDAEKVIAGYCISNDVSEREWQLERSGQWTKGKSFKSFNPTGPFLATKDEVSDPENLKMNLSINGVEKQNGNTKTMIFKPNFIVQHLSQFMTLEAGDLISTGTPPGVGMGFKPQQFLKHGDEIVLEIEGLGKQKQKCIQLD